MNARLPLLGLVVALATPACGGNGRTPVATWDTPVPGGEARATASLTVDLAAASDCDERFDLALYEDRAVELVSWDDAHGCVGRRVQIRYVPGRVTKEALLRRVRALAKKVSEG